MQLGTLHYTTNHRVHFEVSPTNHGYTCMPYREAEDRLNTDRRVPENAADIQ